MLKEHLKVLELTMWISRYLTSFTHGIIWPDKLTTLEHDIISGDVLNRPACLGVRRLTDMMTDRAP